jgi:hypothetical protein
MNNKSAIRWDVEIDSNKLEHVVGEISHMLHHAVEVSQEGSSIMRTERGMIINLSAEASAAVTSKNIYPVLDSIISEMSNGFKFRLIPVNYYDQIRSEGIETCVTHCAVVSTNQGTAHGYRTRCYDSDGNMTRNIFTPWSAYAHETLQCTGN